MNTLGVEGTKPSPALLHVLILENSPSDGKPLVALLESGGYKVQIAVAHSPESFREQLSALGHDVILADFNLGSWTALDALEILKDSGREIPLIVLTVSLGDEAAAECIKHGAADFVLRDRPARLPAAIQRVLEVRSLREEQKRAEKALHESQALKNAIVDSTSDMIWSVDPEDFSLCTFNRSLRGYFFHQHGIRLRLGMRLEDLFPTRDYVDQWHRLYRRALSEGSFTTDYVGYAGTLVLQLTLNVLKRDGQVFGISVFGKDITARKQAEEALRKSEERCREIVESAEAIVWEADAANLRFTFVSQGAGRILGYPADQWLQVPGIWADHLHPDDREVALACQRGVREKGRPRAAEYRMKAADGRTLWFRDFMHAVSGPGGEVECLRGIMVDITDLRQTEEALRESDARLRLVVSQLPAIVWSTDKELRFTSHMGAGLQALGVEPDQMLGTSVDEFLSSFDPKPNRPDDRAALAGKSLNYELAIRGRSYDVHVEPFRNALGEIAGTVGIARDITAKRKAEAALRESEERFRATFENAGIGMAIMDLQGHCLKSNSALRLMLGYSEEEMGWTAFTEYIHPNDRELDWKLFGALSDGKLNRYEIEKRFIKKAGGLLWGLFTASLIMDADGRPLYGLGMVQDVTERKLAEEALRQSDQRYKDFIAHSNEGVWRVEMEQPIPISLPAEEVMRKIMQHGYFAECNEAHARIRGFSAAKDMIGIPLGELRPESDERKVTYLALAQGGYKSRTVEYRGRDQAGNIKDLLRTEVPIFQGGMLVRIWGITRDITELRRAEEERRRSGDQLRALAARLQDIREEERQRVAREIHDQLGQSLTAIKIDLSAFMRELPPGMSQAAMRASSILRLVDESIQTVRRISTELRPGILDDLGLVAALEWAGEDFQTRTGTVCRLDLPQDDIAVGSDRATAIFRIFQETLTNVARHAEASRVDVRLAREEAGLTLEVHDNGRGISGNGLANGKSLGILGMRERALLLGGEVAISGSPGKGTTVRVRIPDCPHI